MKRGLALLGTAAALMLAGVVLWRGLGDLPRLDWARAATWGWLGLAVALYGLSQLLGATLWRILLGETGRGLAPGVAEGQFMTAQIGKYLPGNVGHLLGRAALAHRDGVPAGVVARATAVEIGSLVVAGVLVSGLGVVLVPDLVAPLIAGAGLEVQVSLVRGLAIAVLASALAAAALHARRAGGPAGPVLAICCYMASFVLLGLSLLALCNLAAPEALPDPVTAIVVFAVAWTLGFVMPGAPGGIGVRDGLIALGLGLAMSPGAAVLVAALHRGVSVLGDVLVFGAGLALRRRLAAAEPAGRSA